MQPKELRKMAAPFYGVEKGKIGRIARMKHPSRNLEPVTRVKQWIAKYELQRRN
ncbi:MAG: hypothetical protein AAFX07_06585 [Pseudomonadota bacterium]